MKKYKFCTCYLTTNECLLHFEKHCLFKCDGYEFVEQSKFLMVYKWYIKMTSLKRFLKLQLCNFWIVPVQPYLILPQLLEDIITCMIFLTNPSFCAAWPYHVKSFCQVVNLYWRPWLWIGIVGFRLPNRCELPWFVPWCPFFTHFDCSTALHYVVSGAGVLHVGMLHLTLPPQQNETTLLLWWSTIDNDASFQNLLRLWVKEWDS